MSRFDDALGAFYTVPCRDTWNNFRSFIIRDTGVTGQTVWQALLSANEIEDFRGGRFADGADVPTPDEVSIALLLATTRGAAR